MPIVTDLSLLPTEKDTFTWYKLKVIDTCVLCILFLNNKNFLLYKIRYLNKFVHDLLHESLRSGSMLFSHFFRVVRVALYNCLGNGIFRHIRGSLSYRNIAIFRDGNFLNFLKFRATRFISVTFKRYSFSLWRKAFNFHGSIVRMGYLCEHDVLSSAPYNMGIFLFFRRLSVDISEQFFITYCYYCSMSSMEESNEKYIINNTNEFLTCNFKEQFDAIFSNFEDYSK